MWSAISALIAAISSGIRLATEWLAAKRDKLLIAMGVAKQQNSDLKGRLDGITHGNSLREGARAHAERDPDSWMQSDGFRRSEDEGDSSE